MASDEIISKLEKKHKAEIEELKTKCIHEKEELTNLFLNKLKEVENYHKKMLQDFIVKSNSDLEELQAKHKDKLDVLDSLHKKEISRLQKRIDCLISDKKELEEKLLAVAENRENLRLSSKEKNAF